YRTLVLSAEATPCQVSISDVTCQVGNVFSCPNMMVACGEPESEQNHLPERSMPAHRGHLAEHRVERPAREAACLPPHPLCARVPHRGSGLSLDRAAYSRCRWCLAAPTT